MTTLNDEEEMDVGLFITRRWVDLILQPCNEGDDGCYSKYQFHIEGACPIITRLDDNIQQQQQTVRQRFLPTTTTRY